MITEQNLYGVVVWYNPTQEHVRNIESYVHHVRKLVVVDNSDDDHSDMLVRHREQVIYVANRANLGIAAALNQGCKRCAEMGAEWILTMDQDSAFEGDNLPKMIAAANDYPERDRTGIFSPMHQYHHKMPRTETVYDQRLAVMASGNLLSVRAYRQTKGFKEDFFIDLVDDEYCCQLHRLHYRIVRINVVFLHHSLGERITPVRFLGLFKKDVIDHGPLRRYYIMRNNLYMQQMYPEHKAYYRSRMKRTVKRILLYDSHNKWVKLKYMYYGWRDYRNGILGRCRY